MDFPRERRVMWLSQVRSIPFRERVELTGRAGFGTLSTSPADFDQTVASGLSAADQRRIAEDNGVKLSYLDPLTRWVPDWAPVDEDADILPYLDREPDDFFRIAHALHVEKIHLIGTFPVGRYTLDQLADYFGAMCDRAAREGLICTLEAMPLWGFRRLDDAWHVVRAADRANSGIIFDTWHYTRAGRNDGLLAEIPVGRIDTVQIADGPLHCPPGRRMVRDCLFHRVPIGEGEIPNREILGLVAAAGHLTSVGPEIFSAELDRLAGSSILDRVIPGFEAILREVGAAVPPATGREGPA